jgi:hypothetical protein
MISRFKSDASDASVRGIIVDNRCSHEHLSGCGLLAQHGLKIERFVETTKTDGESLLQHPLTYPILDLQLSMFVLTTPLAHCRWMADDAISCSF